MEVSFRNYIPSKPGSYRLKIVWLNAAENGYALNALPYIGADTYIFMPGESVFTMPEDVTLKVVEPFQHKEVNSKSDNWFTSCKFVHIFLTGGHSWSVL